MKNKLWIVMGVIALTILLGALKYNSLVTSEEKVNSKWAQVENNLQRRADLIPNLVNTVKGFKDHESKVLTEVTIARAGYHMAKTPEDYAEAEAKLQKAINIVVESYPELKSDKNFLALQDELAGTENRLAVSRKDYNEAVEEFNKSIRKFPNNIYASVFNFDKKDYFQIDSSSKENPKVDL